MNAQKRGCLRYFPSAIPPFSTGQKKFLEFHRQSVLLQSIFALRDRQRRDYTGAEIFAHVSIGGELFGGISRDRERADVDEIPLADSGLIVREGERGCVLARRVPFAKPRGIAEWIESFAILRRSARRQTFDARSHALCHGGSLIWKVR